MGEIELKNDWGKWVVKCIQVIDMATNGTSDLPSLIRAYTTTRTRTTTISKKTKQKPPIHFGFSLSLAEKSIPNRVASLRAPTHISHSPSPISHWRQRSVCINKTYIFSISPLAVQRKRKKTISRHTATNIVRKEKKGGQLIWLGLCVSCNAWMKMNHQFFTSAFFFSLHKVPHQNQGEKTHTKQNKNSLEPLDSYYQYTVIIIIIYGRIESGSPHSLAAWEKPSCSGKSESRSLLPFACSSLTSRKRKQRWWEGR